MSYDPSLLLCQMMQYRRPAGSKTERLFRDRYLAPLGVEPDASENLILRVGEGSRALWSCHTDTVHRDGGKQAIRLVNGVIKLAGGSKSNCLGADCTAGVWLMMEMIKAQVPGLYVFHAAEECGGVGSDHIARKTPELLRGIDYAIAFDRYGYDEIITKQSGGLCASDEFAHSLAPMLPGRYGPSPNGLFTDTANYVDLVPECTNIAVGYDHHHTFREHQDMTFALSLREHMIKFDETKLKASRRAGDNGWSSNRYDWDKWDEAYYKSAQKKYSSYGASMRQTKVIDVRRERTARTVNEFCMLYPDVVADLLDQYGITVDELYENSPDVLS